MFIRHQRAHRSPHTILEWTTIEFVFTRKGCVCVHTETVVNKVRSACCGCEGTWRRILIMTQGYELSHTSNDPPPHTPHICDPSLGTRVWLPRVHFCSVFIAPTVNVRHLCCDMQRSVLSPLSAPDWRVQTAAVWKIKRSDNCSQPRFGLRQGLIYLYSYHKSNLAWVDVIYRKQ